MQYTKLGTIVKCHDCEFANVEDYFAVRDFGNNDIAFICRDCQHKYPKTDPREWRTTHFTDGTPVKVDAAGMILLNHIMTCALLLAFGMFFTVCVIFDDEAIFGNAERFLAMIWGAR